MLRAMYVPGSITQSEPTFSSGDTASCLLNGQNSAGWVILIVGYYTIGVQVVLFDSGIGIYGVAGCVFLIVEYGYYIIVLLVLLFDSGLGIYWVASCIVLIVE